MKSFGRDFGEWPCIFLLTKQELEHSGLVLWIVCCLGKMNQSDSTLKILDMTKMCSAGVVPPVDIVCCFRLLRIICWCLCCCSAGLGVVKVLQPANLSQPSLVFGTCADDYPNIKDVRQENVVDLILGQHCILRSTDFVSHHTVTDFCRYEWYAASSTV